jgi:hypothetical protein
MKAPKPDKNGNFVFRQSAVKTVPLLTVAVLSVLIAVFSLISLINGSYISLTEAVVRIALCVLLFVVSLLMIIKSPVYVITNEKVLLYGKWEILFSDIESVDLHDNFLGMLEIKASTGVFTVFSHDISCPIKVFSEILTERITVYEQRNA